MSEDSGSHIEHGGDALHDEELRNRIEQWKAATPPAPQSLEQRVVDALRAERARLHSARSPARRWAGRWSTWAVAAALLLGLWVLGRQSGVWQSLRRQPATGEQPILVADALRTAERAADEHARAIAQLEEAAQPILDRVKDPELPPAKAALLLSYRDRLRTIDSAIAEVRSILRTNPGHAGVRTYLLAAYMDKTQLLREVLALQLPPTTLPDKETKS